MSGDRWVSAKVALGDLSGSDEPTSVLKILDDFKKSTVSQFSIDFIGINLD